MKRKRLWFFFLFTLLIVSVAGCKTQSDKAARDKAYGTAVIEIRLYMRHAAPMLAERIAPILIEQRAVKTVDQKALVKAVEEWLAAQPDIYESGLEKYMDAFSFSTEEMRLEAIELDTPVRLTFTVIVPVNDKNEVADEAASIIPALRIDQKRFEIDPF